MKKVKEKDLTKVVGGFDPEPVNTPFEEPESDIGDYVPLPPPTGPRPVNPGRQPSQNPGFRWPPNIKPGGY